MRGKQQEKSVKEKNGNFFRRYGLYIFLILLLILVPVLIYFSMNWDAHKQISKLSVEGNEFVPQEIIKNLVADSLYKKEKGKVDLIKIRRVIESYPFVENAELMFDSDDRVKIVLAMRYPAAKLKLGKEKYLFTDDGGKILPYLFFDNFSFLPVLTGITRKDSLDTAKFHLVFSLFAFIKKNYKISCGLLSGIRLNADNTFELFLKKGGRTVVFGDSTKKKSKMDKLEIFLENYLENKVEKEIGTIDLRWSNQLVVH